MKSCAKISYTKLWHLEFSSACKYSTVFLNRYADVSSDEASLFYTYFYHTEMLILYKKNSELSIASTEQA